MAAQDPGFFQQLMKFLAGSGALQGAAQQGAPPTMPQTPMAPQGQSTDFLREQIRRTQGIPGGAPALPAASPAVMRALGESPKKKRARKKY